MAGREKIEQKYCWNDRKRTFLGLPLSFTRYFLTEEKLFVRTGFLSMKEEEVRLYRILDVTLKRSLRQRIFGLGTIHCCSADKSTPEFDILSVKNSKWVKETLSDLVEQERSRKRISGRECLSDDDFDQTHD